MNKADEVCPVCGGTIRIGDFPLCGGNPAKHVPVPGFHRPFKPYYDLGLDTTITSYHQARKVEKEQNVYEKRRKRGNLTEV